MQPPIVEPTTLTVLEQHLAVNSDPCPMCSYNLHKLKGSNCPECGHALVLRVAVTNARMAAMYTGLIGLACGLGFALLLLIYIFVIVISDVRQLPGEIVIVLLVEVPVLGGAVLVWIYFSSRIRRMGWIKRWSLVAAAWALSIIAMAAFTVVAG